SALPSGPPRDPTPVHLDSRLPPADSASLPTDGPYRDPNQYTKDQRADARRLVDEGKALLRQNRLDEARAKWQEAIGKAPGTSERDEAAQLLDRYVPPPADAGYPGG